MEEGPKPQFDETLGGSEKLPLNLNVKYFTKARMKEIEALTEAIEDPLQQGMLFQRLPRHMRRRAMGHDDKRMPKKLRKTFSVLLEKCGTKDQPKSRPRRKYRRRPCHLLDEYNRRQREFIWLETHIWHAKRFHMVNKWGYKLANYPNDKCFRACYRATAQHCLLQDISYYNCIEIRGELEKLLNGFTQHTSTACGLTFSAKCFLNGTKEGQVTFFRRNQYPKGAIGDVSFIWKPEIEYDNTRIIWVWVHPALFEEFITEMTCTFELSQVVPDDSCEMEVCDVPENTDSDFTNSVEGKKLKLKNIPFVKVPKYENKLSGISLHVLKDTLNRFRLTGPLTQSVITEAFQAVNLDYFEKSSEEMNQSFKEYFIGHNRRKESATLQHAFWEQIKQVATPAQLPPSCVFSINVVDPRLTMPCKRTKADKDKQECKAQMLPNSYSNLIADSPLWCSKIRDSVTKEKVPSAELYAQRSMKIVPGLEIEQLDTQKNRQTIPILCIQQPGGDSNQRLGYGAGVDLIIPSGWSMPVWIGLVFRGARTGGLREAESLRREIGKLPLFAPDTRAAKTEGDDLETNLLEEYFRKPPSKRNNYIKLGITSPFKCPWDILMKEWGGGTEFYVLRDKSKLNSLQKSLTAVRNPHQNVEDLDKLFLKSEKLECLIPVNLVLEGKGTLDKFAHVCLPVGSDFENLRENKSYQGPIEPLHKDFNKSERLLISSSHKDSLTKLRRKRVKERKRSESNVKDYNNPTEEIIKSHAEKMRRLWLPACTKVKDSTSRTPFGFVAQGSFSFVESCSSGQGYIHLSGLLMLLETLQNSSPRVPLVLVRPVCSPQYRFAKIKIIV